MTPEARHRARNRSYYARDLERFAEELRSMGLAAEPVIALLRLIYAAQELPYEVEEKSGAERRTRRLLEVDEWVERVLRDYGLIPRGTVERTLYGEHANIRFYRLTEDGLRLASQAYLAHLEEVRGRLEDILEAYPEGLIRVLALSAIEPRGGKPGWIEVKVDARDLDGALTATLSDMEVMLVDWGELRETIDRSRRIYGDWRLVDKLSAKTRLRMYEPRVYEIFASRLLVLYNGEVHRKALELMERLKRLGLAARIPLYDSRGRRTTDVYRAPPELAITLLKRVQTPLPEELLIHVFAAQMLHQALRGELTKRELLEAARHLGIGEKGVKMLIEALHAKGITTGYNEAGNPDSPPFIILDEEKARREAEKAVERAEMLVLAP